MGNVFELKPMLGSDQKSFYGKAEVVESEPCGSKILFSYNTQVCYIDKDGSFFRSWNDYSATTMRHINAFRAFYGLPLMSKKEWEVLPTV